MYYNDNWWEELDVESLVRDLGLMRVRRAGSDIRALCPFHDEKTPSFFISLTKDTRPYHCFGCNASGSVIRLVEEHGKPLSLLNEHGATLVLNGRYRRSENNWRGSGRKRDSDGYLYRR